MSARIMSGIARGFVGFALVAGSIVVQQATTSATAAGTPANTAHRTPTKNPGVTGVSFVPPDGCQPVADYSCTAGGYSGKDPWGYWQYGSLNASGRHNCTSYAAFRLDQNGAINPGKLGDADQWATKAFGYHIPVDQSAAVGSIAQWDTTANGATGHVAYVESVTSSGIVITEDNFMPESGAGSLNGGYTARIAISTGSNAWPDNFIHFKDIGLTTPPPSPAFPIITTVAGNGTNGYSGDGGPATSAEINSGDIAADSTGDVYIADMAHSRVRKVDTRGVITTIAGNGTPGRSGDGGPATSANLASPISVAVDAAGNLYIGELFEIRKVDTHGIITTVVGNGMYGHSGDGGPATSAEVAWPTGLAVDATGNLYISDLNLNTCVRTFSGVTCANTAYGRVRKVDTRGVITTVAGNGMYGFSGDGGPATSAALSWPFSLAVDGAGNLYIGDEADILHFRLGYSRVRKVDTRGVITTVAGNGTYGFSGDGGPATSASLSEFFALSADSAGNLYIADTYNKRVRKVDTRGVITTVAGNGTYGFSGDGGPATSAGLSSPGTIAVDGAGNLYISDGGTRIRKVGFPATLGKLTTIIHVGESIVRSVIVPVVKGFMFASSWPGSDVAMTLTSPSGLVIDRSTVSPNVQHELGPTHERYLITDPAPGTWTVVLTGIQVASSGEPVTLQVAEDPLSLSGTPPATEACSNGAAYNGVVSGSAGVLKVKPQAVSQFRHITVSDEGFQSGEAVQVDLGQLHCTATASGDGALGGVPIDLGAIPVGV